jgi:hypothetical protein
MALLFLVGIVILRWLFYHYHLPMDDIVNVSFWGLACATFAGLLAASFLWWNKKKRSTSIIHMANRTEPSTLWERMDAWIDIKGQVKSLFGQILKWGLVAGGGAALLYLYQHWREWWF